ncbi:MAG: hypothetical protein EGR71_02715, partial [Clostridiales bacterium]|nr:hypothetical protein [Clostridiales bacterium]
NQTVNQGDIIGKSGKIKINDDLENALLFEIIHNGNLVNPEKYIITFTGNGFMRYQVRNMVGLLLKVGQEKIDPIMVKQILDSKSRKKNGVTAPAEGL